MVVPKTVVATGSITGGIIDTKLVNTLDTFSGKEEAWQSFTVRIRAYFGAVNS